ncbi:MAG: hypothetical protein DRN04_09245 [Thermoprotei archaeon]|nr:MAG: hypothetical protein DRN04_09245 [Thermoprotei archaeon]
MIQKKSSKKVYLIHRRSELRGDEDLQEELRETGVRVLLETEVKNVYLSNENNLVLELKTQRRSFHKNSRYSNILHRLCAQLQDIQITRS